MRPGGRMCALLLPLLLLAAGTRAFHLTPRGRVTSSCAAAVAAAAGGNVCSLLGSFEGWHSLATPSSPRRHCSSRLLMKAMRLPGLRTPAAPKAGRKAAAVVAWIVPPFLRHLPLLNGGGGARLRAPRVSIRGSAKAAANKRRLAAAPASVSDASLPVAAAYYQDGSGVGGSSPAGAAEGGAEAQGPSSPEAADTVPIVIKYTGGVGFKSVFVGCVRVLKDQFGSSIAIRKTIVAPMEQRGSNKQRAGLFEIIVGDETFASKRGEGVYLPMADIAAAIDRLAQRREKERRAASAVAVAAAAQAAAEEAAAAAAAQGQEDY